MENGIVKSVSGGRSMACIALLGILSGLVWLVLTAGDAAAGNTYDSPMGVVLCSVVRWVIYGNLGRGVATLAIIVIGVGATLGKVSWGLAITVAIGIAVVFGSASIVTALVGASTAACI